MTTADLAPSVHDAGPRRSWSYPATPAPHDPELLGLDVTIGWPMIIVTLILVPPLGALQLTHRKDLPVGLRVAIALLALVIVMLTWVNGLRVLA
jgi:hypothetical protein